MEPSVGLPVLVGLIVIALVFDGLNGVHDASNSIATIVWRAILAKIRSYLGGFLQLHRLTFLVFGLPVATTIGKGIV